MEYENLISFLEKVQLFMLFCSEVVLCKFVLKSNFLRLSSCSTRSMVVNLPSVYTNARLVYLNRRHLCLSKFFSFGFVSGWNLNSGISLLWSILLSSL